MAKQHDYQVVLLITIIVNNAESRDDAANGAIDLIIDEPHEYRDEFECIKVEDWGESRVQL